MQITPILVEDCNSILKKRGIKKRYTLNDRFSEKKSKEMFVLIMSHYNPSNNVERAIRLWNGGVNISVVPCFICALNMKKKTKNNSRCNKFSVILC